MGKTGYAMCSYTCHMYPEQCAKCHLDRTKESLAYLMPCLSEVGETAPDPELEPEPEPAPTPPPTANSTKRGMSEEQAQAMIMQTKDSCTQTCEQSCSGTALQSGQCGQCLTYYCLSDIIEKCKTNSYDWDAPRCQNGLQIAQVSFKTGYAMCSYTCHMYPEQCAKCHLDRTKENLDYLMPCLSELGEGSKYR